VTFGFSTMFFMEAGVKITHMRFLSTAVVLFFLRGLTIDDVQWMVGEGKRCDFSLSNRCGAA